MSTIATDSLALLAYQAGNVATPIETGAVAGNANSQGSQRSITMGEPIPIVFTRRSGIDGGVMLKPGATEAAFSVNGSNAITASYELVLGEGPMESLGLRDVSQNGVRRNSSWMQSFNRRAGSWTPGNSITIPAAGTDYRKASYICGGGSAGYGSYEGLSTLSYQITCAVGDEAWQGQVAAFVRGGLQVTRLVDGAYGSSSNIVDLIRYLLTQTARVPAALIDTASLTAAALFIEANGFRFDGVIEAATNLRDWLAQVLPYYLLKESSSGGKFGLLPVVPTNNDGTISTSAVPIDWTFTDTTVVAGSFEIEYIPLTERKAFCAQMVWRQQDECQWPLMRTTEVRYSGEALSGPFEQHDVSAWITNENHACKAGTFLLARRRYVSHTARVVVLPGAASRAIVAGDIIKLRLIRNSSTGSYGEHNRLYQVQRIRQTVAGEIALELLHFPVNSDGVSLIAIDVANVTGNGLRLASNTSTTPDTYGCTDATVPTDTSTAVNSIADKYLSGNGGTAGRESAGSGGASSTDPLGDTPGLALPYGRPPAQGETISAPTSADYPNQRTQWLQGTIINPDGSIGYEVIAGQIGTSYTITGALTVAGSNLTAVFTCDGSTPSPTNGTIVAPTVPGYLAPTNPLDPLPPYRVVVRPVWVDTGYFAGGEYVTYGKYYVKATLSDGATAPAPCAAIFWDLWLTNSSGVDYVAGSYFGGQYPGPGCGAGQNGTPNTSTGYAPPPGTPTLKWVAIRAEAVT